MIYFQIKTIFIVKKINKNCILGDQQALNHQKVYENLDILFWPPLDKSHENEEILYNRIQEEQEHSVMIEHIEQNSIEEEPEHHISDEDMAQNGIEEDPEHHISAEDILQNIIEEEPEQEPEHLLTVFNKQKEGKPKQRKKPCKKHSCFFCSLLTTQLPRHFKRHHYKEPLVQEALLQAGNYD